MSRIHGKEDMDKNEPNNDKYNTDNELGATICASYIAGVSESPIADQAVIIKEVVKACFKDTEYVALKDAIQGGFPE